jgi:hypothetical protein
MYSVDADLDEQNVEILLKHSDNVNYPQELCVGNEGHLIIVECSVTTLSIKLSDTTIARSMIFPYQSILIQQ